MHDQSVRARILLRASAIKTVYPGSVPGGAKPNISKIGIHSFTVERSAKKNKHIKTV